MDAPGSRGDSRFSLGGYGMGILSGDTTTDMYGNPNVSLGAPGRPGTSLQQQMSPRGSLGSGGIGTRGLKGSSADMCYEVPTSQGLGGGLDSCGVPDVSDDTYGSLQAKKSPPSNGKKTKGRVKIKMEYIENKLRRYTTFSKRKTGIMKKAYELSTLTGTQVMLLVASETGHVYTFATRKLQPMITSEAGKALIQTCLNSPDPPASSSGVGGDQRMSATGFEETELTYNISDEDSKGDEMSVAESSGESSDGESPMHDPEQTSNPPKPPPMPPPTQKSSQSSLIITTNNNATNNTTATANNNNNNSSSNSSSSTTTSSNNNNSNNNNNNNNSLSISTTSSPSAASISLSPADLKRLSAGNVVLRTTGGALQQQSQTQLSGTNLQQPLVGPLLYQVPQGMLCSATSNGVIFSLTQATGQGSGGEQQPQFITIPLSVAMAASNATNGHQTELDLSAKRTNTNNNHK